VNREHLLDAFVPRAGDRIALMGHWIIDCGHTDYETEIHPLTFLITAHTDGDATVAWAFYNPYHVTQVYSPTSRSPAAWTTDAIRSSRREDVPLVPGRRHRPLLLGQKDHLGGAVLLEAEHTSPPPWRVCAPLGTSGRHLRVKYHFTVRPGVTLKLERDRAAGCVTVTATLGSRYVPQDASLRPCTLPWDWLNGRRPARRACPISTSRTRSSRFSRCRCGPLVDNTPDSACGDAFVASVRDGRHHVVRDPSQPFRSRDGRRLHVLTPSLSGSRRTSRSSRRRVRTSASARS